MKYLINKTNFNDFSVFEINKREGRGYSIPYSSKETLRKTQFSKERKSNGRVVNKNIQDHSEILKTKNVLYFDIDKATAAYISAKKNAESRKIKIYNATRGGMLDVFERIDFDELF